MSNNNIKIKNSEKGEVHHIHNVGVDVKKQAIEVTDEKLKLTSYSVNMELKDDETLKESAVDDKSKLCGPWETSCDHSIEDICRLKETIMYLYLQKYKLLFELYLQSVKYYYFINLDQNRKDLIKV
jgi:hypothetical protein